jgi:hypothetical protein
MGLHDQALGEQSGRPVADGCGLGSPGEVDRLIRPGQVERLVRLGGFSENEFTQAGPGALRGIKKCFEDLGDYTPAEIVLWMTERQETEFARLGLPFGGLWGRPLHAIDCQGLFCETDKYCREAAPELASARKRIKARFTPTPEPISLFFPPKWGMNDELPARPVFSDTAPAGHTQAALF